MSALNKVYEQQYLRSQGLDPTSKKRKREEKEKKRKENLEWMKEWMEEEKKSQKWNQRILKLIYSFDRITLDVITLVIRPWGFEFIISNRNNAPNPHREDSQCPDHTHTRH